MATPDGKKAGGKEIELFESSPPGGKLDPSKSFWERVSSAARFAITGKTPDGWFGPSKPMPPVAPDAEKGRAFDYPYAVNISYQPRGETGENQITFATLRRMADPLLGGLDLLRLAIETRKDQMAGQQWTIRLRDEQGDGGEKARAIRAALRRPDGATPFRLWQRMLLEDLLVLDAPAVYINRTRGKPNLPASIEDAPEVGVPGALGEPGQDGALPFGEKKPAGLLGEGDPEGTDDSLEGGTEGQGDEAPSGNAAAGSSFGQDRGAAPHRDNGTDDQGRPMGAPRDGQGSADDSQGNDSGSLAAPRDESALDVRGPAATDPMGADPEKKKLPGLVRKLTGGDDLHKAGFPFGQKKRPDAQGGVADGEAAPEGEEDAAPPQDGAQASEQGKPFGRDEGDAPPADGDPAARDGAEGDAPAVDGEPKPKMGPDGKPVLDAEGKPVMEAAAEKPQAKLGPDGKPLVGPDGKPIMEEGKPGFGAKAEPKLGPDGKPLPGGDFEPRLGGDGKPLLDPQGNPLPKKKIVIASHTADEVGVLLEAVDGATLKRLLRADGRSPRPPEPAFVQNLKGMPAFHYTTDEIIYAPRNARTNRVYGQSPVEQVVTTVDIALRRQMSQGEYYTQGSIPDMIMGVPETWTPAQVAEFQTYWDTILSGDTAARRRMHFVPGGIKPVPTKEPILKDQFDEWLARVICYAFSLSPQALVAQMNRATAETAEKQALSEGLEPLKLWFKDLMDVILSTAFDAPEMEFAYEDEEISDPKVKMDVWAGLVASGIALKSEARDAYGFAVIEGIDTPPPPPPNPFGGPPGMPGQPPTGPDGEPAPGGPPSPFGGKPGAPPFGGKPSPGFPPGRAPPGLPPSGGAPFGEKKPNPFAAKKPGGFPFGKGDHPRDVAKGGQGASGPRKRPGDPVRRLTAKEAAVMNRLALYFQRYVDAVIEALGLQKADELVLTADDLDRLRLVVTGDDLDALISALAGDMGDTVKDAAEQALKQLHTQGLASVAISLEQVNRRAVEWAQMHSGTLITNLTKTMRDNVQRLVEAALEDEASVDQLREGLYAYREFQGPRAEMVARTELAFANVQGNLIAWEDSGVVEGVRWSTSASEACEKCWEMDGIEIGLGETFDFDGEEIDGPPGHPSCRCDLVPLVIDAASVREMGTPYEGDADSSEPSETDLRDAEKVAKGDAEGHPFRGNQFSDGTGQGAGGTPADAKAAKGEAARLERHRLADGLRAMPTSKRDDLDVFDYGFQAYVLYEAQEKMPKKEGTMRGVSGTFALEQECDALANIGGKPYLAVKEEDPDADENDDAETGAKVWAFFPADDTLADRFQASTSDKVDAIAEFKAHLAPKVRKGDLFDRAWMRKFDRAAMRKGDSEGHPFRGNQWTDGAGGGEEDGEGRDGAASDEAKGDRGIKEWADKARDSIAKDNLGLVKDEFAKLPDAERDRVADAEHSVPARVQELLGDRPRPQTGDGAADAAARVLQYADVMHETAIESAHKIVTGLHDDLTAAGVDEKLAAKMTMDVADHLIAQELEGQSRTLGDHGVHHINGNMEVSQEILGVIPGAHDTAENRAFMTIAAAYHDTGYLTPPSGVFLDSDHPRWSQQYFDAGPGKDVAAAFGKDVSDDLSRVIGKHAWEDADFEKDPMLSSFAVADNMALFAREKMPPLLRTIPESQGIITEFAQKKITRVECIKQIQTAIGTHSELPTSVRDRFSHAANEITTRLPQMTLGMVGTKYDRASWEGGALRVDVTRSKANEELGKVLDLNQKQFEKMAKTYHADPKQLIEQGRTTFSSKDGRPLIVMVLHDSKHARSALVGLGEAEVDAFLKRYAGEPSLAYVQGWIAKGDAEGHPFRGNQHTSGLGGGETVAPRWDRKGTPFRAAGFRQKSTGKIVGTGASHDILSVPDWTEDDWEDGFVGHDGRFFTREEAGAYVTGRARGDTASESMPWGREAIAEENDRIAQRRERGVTGVARDGRPFVRVAKGDTEGHPFRGNQYTQGGGGANEDDAITAAIDALPGTKRGRDIEAMAEADAASGWDPDSGEDPPSLRSDRNEAARTGKPVPMPEDFKQMSSLEQSMLRDLKQKDGVRSDADLDEQAMTREETRAALEPMASVGGLAKYVLKAGQAMDVPTRAPRITLGAPKDCFMNATKMMLDDPAKYEYAEGYMISSRVPFPVHHAWVVEKSTGEVVDPTLGWVPGAGYYGVRISTKDVFKSMAETKYYGVLTDGRNGGFSPFVMRAEGIAIPKKGRKGKK